LRYCCTCDIDGGDGVGAPPSLCCSALVLLQQKWSKKSLRLRFLLGSSAPNPVFLSAASCDGVSSWLECGDKDACDILLLVFLRFLKQKIKNWCSFFVKTKGCSREL